MVVSQKTQGVGYVLGWFNYVGNIVTDDRKCVAELQRHRGTVKDVFQKVSRAYKDKKMPYNPPLPRERKMHI